ncbi:hypothetical protein Prum_070140 [Phytohabitans rumicis]|uniref:Uncharacterized protein n=1 Tax=Phytohabitans rumicis TaxID=1076125 RepID=A0A6V8L7Y8_9ACTN|nr:hypothetical protein Prum_070140 [Phytohabitans rumicis]
MRVAAQQLVHVLLDAFAFQHDDLEASLASPAAAPDDQVQAGYDGALLPGCPLGPGEDGDRGGDDGAEGDDDATLA